MNDTVRAQGLRGILQELEALRPNCARRLLRQKELREAIVGAEERARSILDPNSTAFRLFDRMRKERVISWTDHGEYVEPEDCKHLDSRIDIIATTIKELDPDAGTPEELDADLIRDVEALKNLMIAVATGGPAINSVNAEYQERRDHIRAGLSRRSLSDPNPYDDLWAWYGKWSSGDLPTYQSRRQYLGDLFGPLLSALCEGRSGARAGAFTEPTGWAKIDRSLGLVRNRLEEAATELEYQQVGHACREALIDLAQEVYDPDRHPTTDGVDPSSTDAGRMLDAYLSAELSGAANEAARRHAKAALVLANTLTHRRTAVFQDAALCSEATASVVNIVAIVSGKRDPQGKK